MVAEQSTTALKLTVPAVIDKFDNAEEIVYGGGPDRIYAIDSDGIVRYETKQGPSGSRHFEARANRDDFLERGS